MDTERKDREEGRIRSGQEKWEEERRQGTGTVLVPVISAASASTGPSTRQAVRKYVEGMEILQKPLLTPLPLLGQASPLGNSTPSLPTVGRHCQGTSKDSESLPVTSTIINQWALGSQSSTFQQLPSWRGGLSPSSLPAQQMQSGHSGYLH